MLNLDLFKTSSYIGGVEMDLRNLSITWYDDKYV